MKGVAMTKRKDEWIQTFRDAGNSIWIELSGTKKPYKNKASDLNKRIKDYRDIKIEQVKETAAKNYWENETLLNEVLLLTYASYPECSGVSAFLHSGIMLLFENSILSYFLQQNQK
ncbi:MAG: hypothetical protein HFH29_01115 [Eubacterium sp.]|nr:hypothetical protein [Eubacterium sp.]